MNPYQYPYLFSRINIGPVELPNRIAMAPMGTGLVDSDGRVSWPQIDYYVARARGGAGLILVEATRVEKKIDPSPVEIALPLADDNQQVARLNDLAEAIKGAGSVAGIQLSIGMGRQADVAFKENPPVAPSAISSFADPEVTCRPLSLSDIQELVKSTAEASERALLAGFSLIELHGHTGYLFDQFLTSLWNKRDDAYGGNLEGRFRLIKETIDAIRERVGKTMAITFRLSLDHKHPEGRDVKEGLILAKKLEEAGFDAIHVDAGSYDTMPWIFPPTYYGTAPLVELSEQVKREVKIPVITVGSILEPRQAEEILTEGKADLIALGRPLLADPDWPEKALLQKEEEIRSCILCNEFCIGRLFQFKAVSCSVNASCGKEHYYTLKQPGRYRRITVIGGGPAGMEAARIAATRGHQVTLLEKESSLGGQLIPATRPSFKRPLKKYLDYMIKQMEKQGVNVELGLQATPEIVKKTEPDEVVLATGAYPMVPDLPGVKENLNKKGVYTSVKVLQEELTLNGDVVVVGGGVVGCETALFLAYHGNKVVLVEELEAIANDLNLVSRIALLDELNRAGIEIKTGMEFKYKSNSEAFFQNKDSSSVSMKADSLILALGSIPQRELHENLLNNYPRVHLAGDCIYPRKVGDAISEGFTVGYRL